MGEVEQYSVTKGTEAIFTNTYSYANNTTSGTQYKTRRISGEKVAGSSDKYYGYDVQGRLTSITEYRSTTPDKYSYDEYNRLRYIEIGGYNGTWYSYTYDINNNLTQTGGERRTDLQQHYRI